MGKLFAMVALKPPKAARAKKDAVGEKRKKSLSPVHESLPELGDDIIEPAQNIIDPSAPRKSKSRRRKTSHQEKVLVILEGTSEVVQSPSLPAGDKGK